MTHAAMSHKIMELDYAMSIIKDVMTPTVVRNAPDAVIALNRALEDIDRAQDALRECKVRRYNA